MARSLHFVNSNPECIKSATHAVVCKSKTSTFYELVKLGYIFKVLAGFYMTAFCSIFGKWPPLRTVFLFDNSIVLSVHA